MCWIHQPETRVELKNYVIMKPLHANPSCSSFHWSVPCATASERCTAFDLCDLGVLFPDKVRDFDDDYTTTLTSQFCWSISYFFRRVSRLYCRPRWFELRTDPLELFWNNGPPWGFQNAEARYKNFARLIWVAYQVQHFKIFLLEAHVYFESRWSRE